MGKRMVKNYTWDLSKVFKSDEEYQNSLEKAYNLINELKSYKGKITKDSNSLYEFLVKSDECSRLIEKIYVYSYLCYYDDGNNKLNKEKSLKASNLYDYYNENMSFVRSEILSCDYDALMKYFDVNEKLEKYRFSFEKMFRYKDYTLSEKEENVIALAESSFGTSDEAYSALNNLDINLGYIKINGKKQELTNSNYSIFIKNPDRKVRKNAFNGLYNFYEKHINTISNLYVGSIKEHFFISKVRGYKNPLNASLYSDNISEDLFKTLIKCANNNLSSLEEYMKLKNKHMGLKNAHMYDVYLMPENALSEKISFDESIDIICEALKPLGEDYQKTFKDIINKGCVDVYPKKGKRSGAYQWCSYDTPTYVSLNYVNDVSSVSTFAHEMGHAIHSYYSNKKQDYIYASYPIFLAEIASTVNEILLSEYLINNASDDEKLIYICEFLEKARATIYRQVMFSEFESICYDKYDNNIPLTKDELCNTYYELNKKYFGKSAISDEEIKYEWARIPHFYTPFYVYKYATGFTCALIIASKLLKGEEGFKEKYIEFLSSGCSDYPLEIIKKLGIDLENINTLQSAFDYFNEKTNEFKKLIERK